MSEEEYEEDSDCQDEEATRQDRRKQRWALSHFIKPARCIVVGGKYYDCPKKAGKVLALMMVNRHFEQWGGYRRYAGSDPKTAKRWKMYRKRAERRMIMWANIKMGSV